MGTWMTALLAVGAAVGAFACRASSSSLATLDVYVPEPADAGGDATMPEGDGGAAEIDRAGHPLVAVMLVPGPLDDEYNGVASFASSTPRTIQDAIEARLVELDTLVLDGGPDPVDWPIPEGGAHPLLPAFATDVLLVDTNLSCLGADGGFAHTYLDIEREAYLDSAALHTTCGGRVPGEDVVTETLTLLVKGPAGAQAGQSAQSGQEGGVAVVSDGVTGPTKPAPLAFPYLASPN